MSRGDRLSYKIDQTLRHLSPNHSTCSIFKVPDRLRRVNERAYEPEILSIGPYHRGKDNLKLMEENKKRYLKKILERRRENSVERYVMAIRSEEDKARQCYDQSVLLDKDEFVEMLLLDGCFIVELIRKCNNPQVMENDDPVIGVSWILSSITLDMLLLENQLPFFVLRKLFDLTTVMPNEDFFAMTLNFFKWMFRGSGLERNNTSSGDEYKHLLDIVYHKWQQIPKPHTSTMSAKNWEYIRCAKELKVAGIDFKKPKESSTSVHFGNGKMIIPTLKIDDTTESLFRNLFAYEQCSQLKHLYVTDYTILMDCLIDTQEDVQILRKSGIIENGLGDDEMVCTLFNKLGTNVMHSRPHFCYAKVFDNVNKHCKRRHNVWLAKLRRDYFNSPWAGISFIGALALLLLTLVQTVFTVMSYVKQ